MNRFRFYSKREKQGASREDLPVALKQNAWFVLLLSLASRRRKGPLRIDLPAIVFKGASLSFAIHLPLKKQDSYSIALLIYALFTSLFIEAVVMAVVSGKSLLPLYLLGYLCNLGCYYIKVVNSSSPFIDASSCCCQPIAYCGYTLTWESENWIVTRP